MRTFRLSHELLRIYFYSFARWCYAQIGLSYFASVRDRRVSHERLNSNTSGIWKIRFCARKMELSGRCNFSIRKYCKTYREDVKANWKFKFLILLSNPINSHWPVSIVLFSYGKICMTLHPLESTWLQMIYINGYIITAVYINKFYNYWRLKNKRTKITVTTFVLRECRIVCFIIAHLKPQAGQFEFGIDIYTVMKYSQY